MGAKINGSEAYQIAIKMGYDVSYPRFLKWMKEKGISLQPTGSGGGYIIDKARLMKLLNFSDNSLVGGRQGRPPKKEEL